jgi:hypothetical protein
LTTSKHTCPALTCLGRELERDALATRSEDQIRPAQVMHEAALDQLEREKVAQLEEAALMASELAKLRRQVC